MKTFMKILGITFAVVAAAFTVCGLIDCFFSTGRGSYFEVNQDD